MQDDAWVHIFNTGPPRPVIGARVDIGPRRSRLSLSTSMLMPNEESGEWVITGWEDTAPDGRSYLKVWLQKAYPQ
jgi:hypothetical protein